MAKSKIKVSDLMSKLNIDKSEKETVFSILKELGVEAKVLTKLIDEDLVDKFDQKWRQKQMVGMTFEKSDVKEKVLDVGVKRRIRKEVPKEPEQIVAETEEKPKEETPEKPQVQKTEEIIKEEHKKEEKTEKKIEEKIEEKTEQEKYVGKEEVVLSVEEKEKIEKELEQKVIETPQEIKVEKPAEFHKVERPAYQEKKPFHKPKPPFKRDKFDKQVKGKETTLAPGKKEIIMTPKEVKPAEVPVEKPVDKRKGFEKKKEILKKDQLLELKEREDKLLLQKKKKQEELEIQKPAQKKPLKIAEAITVGELAKKMGVKAALVIKTLFDLGMMVTINNVIDVDTASIVASEFGYEVEKVGIGIEELLVEDQADLAEEKKVKRPPVVTIMGHVDHGKTSLLDAIRQTNVVDKEAGGITQHIGAYQVEVSRGTVTFLDTPGHEAFTAMRARGAKATDIVILVVAADEGPMPQTIEALNHAKAANVPIIVAINKIDKPGANPERVKNMLAEKGLIPEEWGGNTVYAEVSAKKRIGIEELLDLILIQAEVMELKANPDRLAKGVIVESKLDKGRGPVATVLIQEGTLKIGDPFIVGTLYGKVRSLFNDKGKKIDKAGPATPVEVLGLPGVPEAGDEFIVVSDERKARQIATLREQKQKEIEMVKKAKLSLEDIYEKIQQGEIQELNIVLKGDVQGSVEAISEALNKISASNVKVNIIHAGVGSVNESDVMLAEASKAIIIGFNVKVDQKASLIAEKNNIDIKIYNIIYELIDNIKLALEGLLKPIIKEVLVGKAEVRQTFSISRIGTIAGCFVLEGKVSRNNIVKVVRDKNIVFEGRLSSLKRFKDDVKEVLQGFECGISIEGFNDIKVGDILEFYETQQIAVKLEEIKS
ncbi:MAG: translation initiation factor IF-2 [Proteobacteria bacterium]|nr:translation initiation factor IF-2 [Pseudomonadota bacterium]